MTHLVRVVCLTAFSLWPLVASADDYRVELVHEPAPADRVSEEIAKTLAPHGMKIIRGESRTICTIWPVANWAVRADFSPSLSILYPLSEGQLLGVVHFPRRVTDFRDQEIDSGVYTLRYALQPEDGSHVGTSDTRDFLLLLPAGDDTSTKTLGRDDLYALSTDAAGGTHPAMLSLLRAAEGAATAPAILHDEARDWWSVQFTNPAFSNGKEGKLTLNLVVIGHAAE